MAGRRGRTREERDDLTGEHKAGDAGQIVIAIVFFAVWIGDTFFLGYTTFLNQYLPLAARIPAGVFVIVLAAYLANRSLAAVFGEERREPCVIRKGVFGVVRHPVYLSEILLYLGALLLSISLAAAGIWVIAIIFLHYISRYEENLLLERFGTQYETYMREVPMWIPRPGRR
jgi:protein-S-isoprenylcysteine O-methyltransferase Ste14